MQKVFVSFADEDRSLFDRVIMVLYFSDLRKRLSIQAGVPIREPGASVVNKIKELILNCSTVVVVWSQNTRCSPFVNFEIGFASAHSKKIIYFKDQTVPGDDIPLFLRHDEWISYDPEHPDPQIRDLLDKLCM